MAGLVALLPSCAEEAASPVSPPASPPPVSTPAPGPTAVPAPAPAVATGQLPPLSNLNVAAGPEHITDLWAHTARNGKGYAYLGSFDRPRCGTDITGVYIVDISDVRNPVRAGFVPSPPGTRVSDVQVRSVSTDSFNGDVLAYSIEFCGRRTDAPLPSSIAGIVLYDVTDPLAPRRLAPDFSLGFEAHNLFLYEQGRRAFVLMVRDESPRDFNIIEITDPSSPVRVSARGGVDWFRPGAQLALGAVPVSFLHDVWVSTYPASHPNASYAGKTVAYLSYWDAGLVLLDITDPANPVFLGDSDYLDPDPLTGQPAEGNSHAAVPTEDGNLVFMGDEDFISSRLEFRVGSGDFAGAYRALEAGFTPRISQRPDQALAGQTVFVGQACRLEDIPRPQQRASPDSNLIALIERGGCPFEDKIASAAAAGYDAAIVFNQAEVTDDLVTMAGTAGKGTIPAVFVQRRTAFAIMGLPPDAPAGMGLPPAGTVGQRISIGLGFDGWGYGRILDVRDPGRIAEVGRFATPEVLQKPAPPGVHSIHNVVVKGRRAYISWYADGIVVVDFSDPANPRQVARFVDAERGSDFWGVFLYEHPDGNTYILGSDRSTGLWIFQDPGL